LGFTVTPPKVKVMPQVTGKARKRGGSIGVANLILELPGRLSFCHQAWSYGAP
jgi:hypothetical protein